jgi:hypothetical protein
VTIFEQGAYTAQIGNAPASQIRHTRTGAQRSVLVLASSIVVAFLAAANAPSPLYARYKTAWHASPLIGTIAFAAYAVAVIVGLLWLSCLRRVAVPANTKTTFMSTAPVVFAVWALSGFYAALSPALYGALSRSHSVWQSALPLSALLAAATTTTVVLVA